jgi:membrane-bound inhibitor of C-type lysozyme
MKRLAGLWIIGLLCQQCEVHQTIESTVREIEVDQMHNLYYCYDDHLEVKRVQGGPIFRQSQLSFGPGYVLDISNSLKPFLFYQEQGIMIPLDNMLNQQGDPLDLFENGFGQIEAMAGSKGDHYWMWDGVQSELLRVNQKLQVVFRSGNLAARLGKEIHVLKIEEDANAVMIWTTGEEALIFDNYGGYRLTVSLPGARDVQLEAGLLHWREDSLWISNDWLTGAREEVILQDSGIKHVQIQGKKLFILSSKGVTIWPN